jgi:hypothetical protein
MGPYYKYGIESLPRKETVAKLAKQWNICIRSNKYDT